MAEVTIRGLRKSYGSVEVIHGVDLDISDGEFAVLVGPFGEAVLELLLGRF